MRGVLQSRFILGTETGLAYTPVYAPSLTSAMTGLRQILDNYSGVSIYRDGFRVHPPTVSEGLDWLSLDTRSPPKLLTLRLANNQIIAALSRFLAAHNAEPPLLIELPERDSSTMPSLPIAFKIGSPEFSHCLRPSVNCAARPREELEPQEVSTLFEPFRHVGCGSGGGQAARP